MKETVVRSTEDAFNAIQEKREEDGIPWADFEIETGIAPHTVLKWGRNKSGCRTEYLLRALAAFGLEMVIRPMRKEGGKEC